MAKLCREVKESINFRQIENLERNDKLMSNQYPMKVSYEYRIDGKRYREDVVIIFYMGLNRYIKKIITTSENCNIDAAKYLLKEIDITLAGFAMKSKKYFIDVMAD